jgi:predicted 3-demethylubiquinone-9 3-methyltransferase (glyoxalase superfamily)
MALVRQKIVPCLWFDTKAEDAAKFYVGIFKNSRIGRVSRFPDAGKEIHGKDAGTVMTVEFELEGQTFTALNGGPQFTFDEAISFQVMCDTQDEIDNYWSKLTADGGEEGPCGWLKDKFKLSWQIVPSMVPELMAGGPDKAARVMNAFMQMKKLDIETLKRAAEGK